MNNLITYQADALRTEKILPTFQGRLRHAALGLITETGEIVTELKRMEIYSKPLDDARRKHIAEEIGDVCWYLAIASDTMGRSVFRDLVPVLSQHPDATFAEAGLILAHAVGIFSEAALTETETSADLQAQLGAVMQGIAQSLVDLAGLIGIPMDRICGENIAKLRERFPDAYSDEAAEARADKGGLDARNS